MVVWKWYSCGWLKGPTEIAPTGPCWKKVHVDPINRPGLYTCFTRLVDFVEDIVHWNLFSQFGQISKDHFRRRISGRLLWRKSYKKNILKKFGVIDGFRLPFATCSIDNIGLIEADERGAGCETGSWFWTGSGGGVEIRDVKTLCNRLAAEIPAGITGRTGGTGKIPPSAG